MVSRSYSDTTLKVLFGRSGNQCAYPGCTNNIIAPETSYSDDVVAGHICHIYALADNGPRGNPNLTEAERNAPGNLILMCAHHHTIVDKQYETYPAKLLIEWKEKHEAKFEQDTAEALKLQERMQQLSFLQAHSDKEIEAELTRIRQGRSLHGFPTESVTLQFAERVEHTELVGGSKELRARALAWCARLLSHGKTRDRAIGLLEQSKALASTEEADIAEAVIRASIDRNEALALLARINTPRSRTAALRTMANSEGPEEALQWVVAAGLTLSSFDADGKVALIQSQLQARKWQDAAANTALLMDADFLETPVLHSAAAMSYLVCGVPDELRASVTMQVPFHAIQFRLSSDAEALLARRKAVMHFEKLAEFAKSVGVLEIAHRVSEYALWLELRDPRDHEAAIEKLRAGMRDPDQQLKWLNLALQFGLPLDTPAIEKEIDRRVALSGNGSMDEAIARLALVSVQRDEKEAANYIAKHRTQLFAHLDKNAIRTIETEMLARSKQIALARERLAETVADGLDRNEEQRLTRIIAEAEGADPLSERKALYETTRSLIDLGNLIHLLIQKEVWEELCPYAEVMFSRTHAVEDAVRYAQALHEARQFQKLHEFLVAQPAIVALSDDLKTTLSWSYFRMGEFGKARAQLNELSAGRDDPNDRHLRVNLALASGRWDDLVQHCASEWQSRDHRTAAELIQAGQLAQAVGAPHAKDFVRAAVAKAPNDPNLLLAAYTQSVQAGWEQGPETSHWLSRAAEMSGDDGPVRPMSMKEVIDQKPEWDKRESTVLKELNEGQVPMFAAAIALNRSFLDLVLFQPLANLSEDDVRRRSVVYAFSGARPATGAPAPEMLALDPGAIVTLAHLQLLSTVLQSYLRIVTPVSTLGWLFQERLKVSFHQPSQIRDAHLLKRLVAEGALRVLPEQPLYDMALAREIGVGLSGMLLSAKSRHAAADGVSRYVVRSAPVHRLGSLLEEEADISAFEGLLCSCQAVIDKLREKGVLTLLEEQRAVAYLKLHERRWPNEKAIADGSELYLDELSVSYFLTVGVLGKLKSASLTAYVPESEDINANRLVTLESLSTSQLDLIEAVRKALSEGLDTGKVRAVMAKNQDEENQLKVHPTFQILGIEEPVDAFIVDDRYINRHTFIDTHDRRTTLLTSFDVLSDLNKKGSISQDDYYAHLISLRRLGFQLIPIVSEELVYQLGNARVTAGAVVETAELRAIRESWLKARMTKMLQLPLEAQWLHQGTKAMVETIHMLWTKEENRERTIAGSNWILDLFDIRGWTPSVAAGTERQFALYGHAAHVQTLLTSPYPIAEEVRDAYHTWVEENVLASIKQTEPEVFDWLTARAAEFILHAAESAENEAEG